MVRPSSRQHLAWHHRRDDVCVAFGIDRLVPNARDDEEHLGCAPVHELEGLFEPVGHDFTLSNQRLETRVGDLDALLFEPKLFQVPPPRAPIVGALAAWLAVTSGRGVRFGFVVGDAQRAGKGIELAHLLGKLYLQLLRVVATLGLRDEQTSLEQLEFVAQPLVRSA
jgi:hypothetical protein